MAKVKITGHASGTGVVTVTAPNTSTDRTITLPDGDVTLGAATPSIVDGGNATAITIDSSENVGIGTTSPTFPLEVSAGSGDSPFKVSSTDPTVRIWSEDSGGKVYWECQSGDAVIVNDSVETLRIKADGRGLSQFTAKAWCAWDATGTPAITDSHNVSSLTDAGTGEQKLNFTNNLATADAYTVSALASKGGGAPSSTNNATCTTGSSLPVTGPYIGVIFNGSASDRDYVCATCFGD